MDKNNLLLNAFRQYRWAELWQAVRDDAPVPSDELRLVLRACLLVAWWQEPEAAALLLAKLGPSSEPVQIFLRALARTCLADPQAAPKAIAQIKRRHAPTWMADWLAIEYAGRTRRFAEQARLLESILKAQPEHTDWPYAACLQSLDQPAPDISALRALLAGRADLPPLGRVLAVRLGLQEPEAVVEILRGTNHCGAYLMALHYLAASQTKRGLAHEAILNIDALAKAAHLDKPLIDTWLGICVSNHAGANSLAARVRHAAQIAPREPRVLGKIASYQLIQNWANGRYADAYAIVKQFHGFTELAVADVDYSARTFFGYVLRMAAVWQHNPDLYDAQAASGILNVLGESHSLSPANAVFGWMDARVKVKCGFVMGIKMHHLAQPGLNLLKSCVIERIAEMAIGTHLLLTIGEIDCRPDEGVWVAARKGNAPLPAVIANTVGGYLAWIDANLAQGHFASVTLQGVPAPGYSLDGKRDPGDKAGFLAMIREVNAQIKRGALERGWNFLDVYAATVNEDGSSNGKWHLDGYHLTPTFYRTADQHLVKPTIGIDHQENQI